MPGPQRRFLLYLTALVVVCAAAQAFTGVSELTLCLTPLFLIAALLLSGRYIGEDRIVARRHGASSGHRGRVAAPQRWRPRAVLALRSVFLQGSFGVRGPPASLAPAA